MQFELKVKSEDWKSDDWNSDDWQQRLSGLFLESDDEETLWQKLHDYAGEHFGVTSVLFGFCHSKTTVARTGITAALVIKCSHPDEYLQHFQDALLENESSAVRLFYSQEPFLWQDSLDWDGKTDAQVQRDQKDTELGMEAGASFGFTFSEGHGISGIGLAASNTSFQDFEKLWRERFDEMNAMVHAFEPLMRQRMVESRFRLAPRERDVLAFSAGGMSAKEIGAHLGIATKTVFNAMERARKSLGAATTAEAVARAYVYNLL